MIATPTDGDQASLTRRDMDALQGKWDFVAGRWPSQLSFVGDHFTVRFQNGDTYHGTYTLDPTRRPKAIDMTVTDGPEAHEGLIALCLYELDGDQLRWCPA